MNWNERRDMPIIIGIAVAVCLSIIVAVLVIGWRPS